MEQSGVTPGFERFRGSSTGWESVPWHTEPRSTRPVDLGSVLEFGMLGSRWLSRIPNRHENAMTGCSGQADLGSHLYWRGKILEPKSTMVRREGNGTRT